MRHALRCARIEAQLTWFFQLSWRSMSSRQCKQMKGSDLTEDDHLQAMRIRVKVLEPTVAALADAATEHCWPKSASKTAVVRCAQWTGWSGTGDTAQEAWRHHTVAMELVYVRAPCRRTRLWAHTVARNSRHGALLSLLESCSRRKRIFHFYCFLGRDRPSY